MTRKRKAVDLGALRDGKPKRNRASPCGIVKLYDHLTEDQVAEVVKMQLDSMLDIKCPVLYNTLNHWFAGTYDKDTREFVIPGRGRIPLNAQTVFRSLGLPMGEDPVIYVYDAKLASEMGPILFGEDGITPKTSRVLEILIAMTEADDAFKQVFVMYAMSTVVRPTTSPKVSSRCYPVMVSSDIFWLLYFYYDDNFYSYCLVTLAFIVCQLHWFDAGNFSIFFVVSPASFCFAFCKVPTMLFQVATFLFYLVENFYLLFVVQANVNNVHNMNWCQFVADQLHGALSSGKWNKTCLFLMQVFFLFCSSL